MRYVVIVVLMTLIFFDLSIAQTRDTQRESLRGLAGVEVTIEPIEPDAKADGLSEEAIRTAVELILQSSGIRILPSAEKISSTPFLYVRGGTYKLALGLYAHDVRIELKKGVSFVNRPQHMMSATTWETESLGTPGSDNLLRAVITFVENLVKIFSNDFLTVNPR